MQIQIQIEKCKSLKRLEWHTRVESSQLLLLQARQLVLNRSFDVVIIIVLLLLQSSTYCIGNANKPPPIQEFSNAKMCIWKRVMNKLNSQPLHFKMSH